MTNEAPKTYRIVRISSDTPSIVVRYMNHYIQRFFFFGWLGLFFLMLLTSLTSLVNAQSVATTTVVDGSMEQPATRAQYIRGWRGSSSDLQQKISALDSNIGVSVYMPVLFGVEINNLSPNFGDPRSGGRTHAGEDIMAVKGTPVISPTSAVVLRVGVGTGEGNYVYTANPGGETFVYMHLDKIGEGVTSGVVLEKGSLIGYVGNTGNASGGAAHLHFEIHNNNGTPIDPLPRLTGTFSLQEKMSFLSKVLIQTSDGNALAQLLVLNFRSTFNNAVAANIFVPQIIRDLLVSITNIPPSFGSGLPLGDLALGSKGASVVLLQQYLITKNIGPFAKRLSLAGTTGNFGAITESALVEYQLSVGIIPANGYFGSATRLMIEANPLPFPPNTGSGNTMALTRDIFLGSIGEDVRLLQKFLNSQGYVVSTIGAGSIGNETIYFGPATKSAVIKLQINSNISPSVGYVGTITRAKLMLLGI